MSQHAIQGQYLLPVRPLGPCLRTTTVAAGLLVAVASNSPLVEAQASDQKVELQADLAVPVVLTQVPAGVPALPSVAAGLRLPVAEGARVVLVQPDGRLRVLSEGFHSACDPSLSFDGQRILFAAQRRAEDNWDVYELPVAGGVARQITRDAGNCRQPSYQATLYTIESAEPWYQLTFVSDLAGTLTEDGARPAHHLYSCLLDGTDVRRITYNISDDADPFLMGDGRLLYASWQRATLARGLEGRAALFGVNIDGTDNALFADTAGRRFKRMPCVTNKGVVVFIESDTWGGPGAAADGSGQVATVSFRRPLGTYRSLTTPEDGWFHSPSPWVDGRVLISHRPRDGGATHGLYLLAPRGGQRQLVWDDPAFDEIQARAVTAIRESDGRSSVVNGDDPHGQLYCLDAWLTDQPDPEHGARINARRLRVLEGVPVPVADRARYELAPGVAMGASHDNLAPLVARRVLGEVDIQADGSFNLELPANTPLQLQTVDEQGMALRTCGWIWVRNHEPRGCVGCHEDGELVPENVFPAALREPSIKLTLPPARRRTVDYRRDVAPLVAEKCVSCHSEGGAVPRLDGGREPIGDLGFSPAYAALLETAPTEPAGPWVGKYVHPGQARTSPLIWHLLGRNTSRAGDTPWRDQPAKPIPADQGPRLTAAEQATFIEWIDLGAAWQSGPAAEQAANPTTK